MDTLEPKDSIRILKEVGAELCAERMARGLTIKDVSSQLRILPEYLDAIEKGDADGLPGMTYAIGYIRSYAGLLGLPADALCQRLRDSLSGDEMRPHYEFVENKLSRPNSAGRMAFAALMMLMVAYGGWYAWDVGSFSAPAEDQVVEVQADDMASQPVAETAALDAIEPEADQALETATAGAEPAAEDQPSAVVEPAETVVLAEPSAAETVIPAVEPITPSTGEAVAHHRNPLEEMVLRATATSWVEITRPDGSIVSAWLMREGDEYTIPGDQDIYLTAGNAGGLEIDLGRNSTQMLGEWGETISELPLDAALLSERY